VRRTSMRDMHAGGRIKLRPLGIPAMCDRMVQEALRLIRAPIWEADVRRHASGFRPHRSPQDAVASTGARLAGGRRAACGWSIEGDIQSCFDTIDHLKLMQLLRGRIKDKKVLSLVWKFLRTDMMEPGDLRHAVLGTPHGGMVSPLLANRSLHA